MPNLARINLPKFIDRENPGVQELLVFLFAILFLGGSLSYILLSRTTTERKTTQPTPTPTPPSSQTSAFPYTIVYGTWKDNNSLIKAYDMLSGKEYLLASFPINIKQVNILSQDEIIYIGSTDNNDLGKEILIYNLKSKSTKSIFSADPGFGIKEYGHGHSDSLNRRFLTVWEVKFKDTASRLDNSQSRVYSLDLSNPKTSNLIEDEDPLQTQFIHIPVAVTNSGNIYLDTYLPNCGSVCWAYGMRVSNFEGNKKEDLSNMESGSYAPLPSLSPNSLYISFLGYDGSMGPANEIKNGARIGPSNPNTVDLLDISTNQRKRLPNMPGDRMYLDVYWDKITDNNLIIGASTHDRKTIETYWYNLSNETLEKVTSERFDDNFLILVSSLSQDSFLLGSKNISPSSMGNLDSHGHAYMYTGFSILNKRANTTTSLAISDPFIQFIALVASPFFQNLEEISSGSKKVLQLETFGLKPDLAPRLIDQMTNRKDPLTLTCPNGAIGVMIGGPGFLDCSSSSTIPLCLPFK